MPDRLLAVRQDIEARQGGAFRHLLTMLTNTLCIAPEDIPNYMADGALYLYLDARLKEIIRDLVRDLQYEQNEAVRSQLCHALTYRREQQQTIAHLLEYPAAIAGRYSV